MSTTTQSSSDNGTTTATAPARFAVTTLPVADVDRAKAFYLEEVHGIAVPH